MADIRQIENSIRDSFAVLGIRNDLLDAPLSNIAVADVQCGIIRGQRIIILPLLVAMAPVTRRIGGLKLEVATGLQSYGFPINRTCVLIWCTRINLREAFNRLMADLLLDLSPTFTFQDIIDRLEGWKLLLTGGEEKNVEKGLWGELYFLRFLLQSNQGGIENWSGPLGGTKDFQFQDRRAEIKTTAIRSGWPVTMNGLYQATSVAGVTDFLVFVRLEEDNSGISVFELISDVRAIISGHSIELLENRLEVFSSEVINSTRKWSVLEVRIFRVSDRHPVIRPESFVEGTLPQGVLNITYTADLTGLPSFSLQEWSQDNEDINA